jgi:hypothetical protein
MLGDLNAPSSATTERVCASRFVHVTTVPFVTCASGGSKADDDRAPLIAISKRDTGAAVETTLCDTGVATALGAAVAAAFVGAGVGVERLAFPGLKFRILLLPTLLLDEQAPSTRRATTRSPVARRIATL